jgi:microcystin-dependent protein
MDPFVAEIRIFPFNFAPKGWAFCDGQILSISQNTALFSLIGTMYGGDGISTFALPNFQGAAPLQAGQGPGLSLYDQGQTGGQPTVTLLPSQIPSHQHSAVANTGDPVTVNPANQTWSVPGAERGLNLYHSNAGAAPQMSPQALSTSGGNLPHNNMPPYLALNFCIALQGVYPPRS